MTGLSERDDITLRVLAIIEQTTVVEQRRQALAAYTAQARRDPRVAEIVKLTLASCRERQRGMGNVVQLRGGPARAAGERAGWSAGPEGGTRNADPNRMCVLITGWACGR